MTGGIVYAGTLWQIPWDLTVLGEEAQGESVIGGHLGVGGGSDCSCQMSRLSPPPSRQGSEFHVCASSVVIATKAPAHRESRELRSACQSKALSNKSCASKVGFLLLSCFSSETPFGCFYRLVGPCFVTETAINLSNAQPRSPSYRAG